MTHSFALLDELRVNTSYELAGKWDFIKIWGYLNEAAKLKHYDEYASHDLNLFIYFRDRTFLTKHVTPFL